MRLMMRLRAAVIVIAASGLIVFGPLQPARAADVVVFAAASLKNALDDAAHTFEQQGGAPVRISYAASSQLAKQIESGAPADIFISADLAWMDYLQQRNLILPASRRNLLGNELVLVAPAGSGIKVDIKPGFDLVGLLHGGRLAMADPDSVPAGKYGKAALEKLGIWQQVMPHVAGAENVRAALLYVDRKETPLGIVYATDGAADPNGRNRRRVSRAHSPADHLPDRSDGGEQEPRRLRIPRLSRIPGSAPGLSKAGLHRAQRTAK